MGSQRGRISTFRDLRVWQKAHALVLEIYRLTQKFPAEEKFGLVSQLRRMASSVPTNIVEGHRRRSRKEYLYFLNRADGSLEETKYHMILARDLGYVADSEFEKISERCDEIGKMLLGLQKGLRPSPFPLPPYPLSL